MRTFERIACGLALTVCGSLVGMADAPASCTVSTAAELQAKLLELNSNVLTDKPTIYLEAGEYDVSGCAMAEWNRYRETPETTNSHLTVAGVKLVGKTGNPRDVVIYGNRTRRIILSSRGELYHMTISNGYSTVDGGGVRSFDDNSHDFHGLSAMWW